MNGRSVAILLVENNQVEILRLPTVDGIDVLREIKGHPVYRTVPVVMLTTSQEEAEVRTSFPPPAAATRPKERRPPKGSAPRAEGSGPQGGWPSGRDS